MNSPASALDIDVIVSVPFMENTYIVRSSGAKDCLVVDPGLEPRKIFQVLDRDQLNPVAILLTHGHADHIGGNRAMKERWPDLPILIGRGDAPMLTDAKLNLSTWGGTPFTSPPADRLLDEGERLNLAGLELDILEIPGHSPGHIVYLLKQFQPHIVLGGDVLFEGSIGRCDFPGGNQRQLVTGIRQKLFTLPDDTIVHPGHGESTTTGIEKQTNPFCGLNG